MNEQTFNTEHPLEGQRVVAVLPNGFVHFGVFHDLQQNGFKLTDASNLRYWKKRDKGLPEFALSGPIDGDRIDSIGTVFVNTALFFYPCGDWK